MLAQFSRLLAAHEQDAQLKVTDKNIVRKIGARKQGPLVYNGCLSMKLPRLSR
jgi:hypothetical protein